MTAILEEDALTEWICEYLEADSELMGMLNGNVQVEARYRGEASPFIRIDRLDGEDLMVIGLHRVWVDTQWHIRGVQHWEGSGRPDRTEINAIGARIDALLHDREASTVTHTIHSFREEPTPMATLFEQGELWLQSGGIYRLRVFES